MKPTLHTTDTSTVKRAGALGIFIVAAFVFLLLRILFYQTVGYEKYRDKVLNQITTEAEVVAERGKIYDRNGVLLATSVTTYRVFIAPRIVARMSEEQGLKYDVLIATELTDGSRELEEVNRIVMDNWSQVLLDDVRQKFNQRVNTATYQAFQLFALQERPVDKVADFLGCTINQVYQAKKRCLSVLDDILREFHKEDPELPAQTLKEVFLAFMDGRESIGKRDQGTSAS